MDPRRPVASFCNQQTINNSPGEFTFCTLPPSIRQVLCIHCISQNDWGYAVEKNCLAFIYLQPTFNLRPRMWILIFLIFYELVCKEKNRKKCKMFYFG